MWKVLAVVQATGEQVSPGIHVFEQSIGGPQGIVYTHAQEPNLDKAAYCSHVQPRPELREVAATVASPSCRQLVAMRCRRRPGRVAESSDQARSSVADLKKGPRQQGRSFSTSSLRDVTSSWAPDRSASRMALKNLDAIRSSCRPRPGWGRAWPVG